MLIWAALSTRRQYNRVSNPSSRAIRHADDSNLPGITPLEFAAVGDHDAIPKLQSLFEFFLCVNGRKEVIPVIRGQDGNCVHRSVDDFSANAVDCCLLFGL